jgi:WD40 repeat protein
LLPAPIPLGSPGNGVAFSPDRRRLAVAVADGRVLLIDPATGRMLRTIRPLEGADGGAVSVAFAPDGSLATGTWAGIVQFWNPVSGVTVGHPVLVASAPVSSIAFAPGAGRFATSGGSDGTLKLWFTSTLQQEGPSLDNEGGTWGNAVFTPDGRWLVAIHSDGHGFLWPVSLGDWESHACAVAGRNMTREEWSRLVAGLSYRPICG